MQINRRYFSRLLLGSASLCGAGLLSACGTVPLKVPILPRNSVLANGDSITYGTGTNENRDTESYPALLATLTKWNVVNESSPGRTSRESLQRLPRALDEHRPRLVMTCIGINDFNQGIDAEETYENISMMCELVRASWAHHILIAQPLMSDSFWSERSLKRDDPVYERIAKENHIPVLSGALSHILNVPEQRDDLIHPNSQGYAHLVQELLNFLYQENFLLYNKRWHNFLKG